MTECKEHIRLAVKNLSVEIRTGGKDCKVLNQISFTAKPGEIIGLVGESGCGKSMTSLAIMGLLPSGACVSEGEIQMEGKDLLSLSEAELCSVRGGEVAMIFQEPMSALNPLIPVGKQIEECYRLHHKAVSAIQTREITLDMMRTVGLSRVESLYHEFPHQLSGGMKQRIVIAMALINRPRLIIADEPTTALDVTIQAQILELLKKMNVEYGCTVLFISHDLGVIRTVCDQIVVMYAGRIVEQGKTEEVLKTPGHPYTRGLLSSIAGAKNKGEALYSIPGYVEPLEKREENRCPFVKRCERAQEVCHITCPDMKEIQGRKVRCFYEGDGRSE